MTKSTYYVNTNSTPGGDGTTFATSGTNRAFASLAEAEAGLQRTINVGDEVEVLCGGTMADTAQVIIDGWTINGRLTWKAIDSHGGKWNDSIYRLKWAATSGTMSAFHIFEDNVTLDNLQLRSYFGADNPFAVVKSETGTIGAVIKNCFVRSSWRAASLNGADMNIFNNILVTSISSGDTWAFGAHGAGLGKKIYNNTIVSNTVAATTFSFTGLVENNAISLQNNLIITGTSAYNVFLPYGTSCFTSDTGYNVSTGINGTGPNLMPGSNNKFSQTITFVDPANYDYRTTDTDVSVANNLYSDAVAPITTDITGKARPSVGAVFAGAYEPLNRSPRYSAYYFNRKRNMITGKIVTILNGAGITASVDGSSVVVGSQAYAAILRLTATKNSGTATLAVKIQHSPTGDSGTWKDLATFSTFSDTGFEDLQITDIPRAIWPCLRAVVTITGTSNWDINVILGVSA